MIAFQLWCKRFCSYPAQSKKSLFFVRGSPRKPKPWGSLIWRNLKEELKQGSNMGSSFSPSRAVPGPLKFRVIAAHQSKSPWVISAQSPVLKSTTVLLENACSGATMAVYIGDGWRQSLLSICSVPDAYVQCIIYPSQNSSKKEVILSLFYKREDRLRGEEAVLRFKSRQVCKSSTFPMMCLWEKPLLPQSGWQRVAGVRKGREAVAAAPASNLLQRELLCHFPGSETRAIFPKSTNDVYLT